GAGKTGIDERDDASNARYPEPYRHIFWAIGHEEAYAVANANSLLPRPAGIAVGGLRKLAVGQCLPLAEERRRAAVRVGELLNHHRQRARRLRGDARRPFQSAQPGLLGRPAVFLLIPVGVFRRAHRWGANVLQTRAAAARGAARQPRGGESQSNNCAYMAGAR